MLAGFEGPEHALEKAIAAVCSPSSHYTGVVEAMSDVPGAKSSFRGHVDLELGSSARGRKQGFIGDTGLGSPVSENRCVIMHLFWPLWHVIGGREQYPKRKKSKSTATDQ